MIRQDKKALSFWLFWGPILCVVVSAAVGLELGRAKKHDFTGKCSLCHTQVPGAGASFEQAVLTLNNDVDHLCVQCHAMNKGTSHPVDVSPGRTIALQRYLDGNGRLTCITCHDVHKEDHAGDVVPEAAGLLRGHAKGRAFCMTCHDEEILGANWRHTLAVNYAHTPRGKFTQSSGGGLLDEYSVECLSCHDGVISKMGAVDVHSGEFKHGIGLSHPVGVEYPQMSFKNDYVPVSALPPEVPLFQGKIGCLTCHSPYGGKKSFLVEENRRSTLCLTCHRK